MASNKVFDMGQVFNKRVSSEWRWCLNYLWPLEKIRGRVGDFLCKGVEVYTMMRIYFHCTACCYAAKGVIRHSMPSYKHSFSIMVNKPPSHCQILPMGCPKPKYTLCTHSSLGQLLILQIEPYLKKGDKNDKINIL